MDNARDAGEAGSDTTGLDVYLPALLAQVCNEVADRSQVYSAAVIDAAASQEFIGEIRRQWRSDLKQAVQLGPLAGVEIGREGTLLTGTEQFAFRRHSPLQQRADRTAARSDYGGNECRGLAKAVDPGGVAHILLFGACEMRRKHFQGLIKSMRSSFNFLCRFLTLALPYMQ
jgi:hypothetical protein